MKNFLTTGNQPSVLWLVVARSGSKGLPHKNIRLLGGIPLLAWRINSALACGGTVWLSTDSQEYADIGQQYGAEVPFLRPPHLSTDEAASVDVCLHAMQVAQDAGLHFDMLGLLQPTSPFVRAKSLSAAVAALAATPEALGAVAVRYVHPHTQFVQPEGPWLDILARRIATMQDTRRQVMSKEITPCGGVYLTRWQALWTHHTLFTEKTLALPLEHPETVDIDTDFDFKVAELLLAQETDKKMVECL